MISNLLSVPAFHSENCANLSSSKRSARQNLCCVTNRWLAPSVRQIVIGTPGDGSSGLRGGGFDKGSNTGLGGTSSGGGGNKDRNFLCPNCGNVCTQIEEFLCKFVSIFNV